MMVLISASYLVEFIERQSLPCREGIWGVSKKHDCGKKKKYGKSV